jgi:hypothetical protein
MDRELQAALRARLHRLHALRPEAVIDAIGELAEDLDDVELLLALEEADLLDDDPRNSGELGPFVGAPIRPRPHLSSGAIALPEPDEPDR